ncbi:organic cation transporter -like [Brachionus plicatilis]|uniref:Organic cation transporter-like n=1 Tax=Brachionus plicatilis TaxID=10195 RepID=A0A3M7QPP3_BRAPC|nr:organic cation transporter -like [Brachionus plicatilis]
MGKACQDKTTTLFEQVGEFGVYQLVLFLLVGLISFIPAIVGYSFSFYAATPNYRCQIPSYPNDTYEIQNDFHKNLVDKYIPRSSDNSYRDKYDKCRIKWNLVCQNSAKKSLFSTFYFIGTYGVILCGILSDRFGRKKTTYGFILANAILNISLTFLITYDLINYDLRQTLFAVIRLLSGIASNVYSVSVVLEYNLGDNTRACANSSKPSFEPS